MHTIEMPKVRAAYLTRLTDEEKSIIDARLEKYHQSPESGSPWDDVYQRIVNKQPTRFFMKIELVTTLKRQATKILAELHESKEPVLITEHGQPSAYLVDVDAYELMQSRMRLLEGIAKGETAILENRTYSQSEAKEKMGKWLK